MEKTKKKIREKIKLLKKTVKILKNLTDLILLCNSETKTTEPNQIQIEKKLEKIKSN